MSARVSGVAAIVPFGNANRDIAFAVGIAMVLAVLFVPLPPILLDFGLAVSLSFSALILMVALWVPRPLAFNSFPTLLLVVTMLRLSLNVASTRLILSEGHTGTHAAGGVIEGFSRFIATGSFVIGIIVFAILVVINFIVISKGSTRIAEVSARFALDAMPGKQMAIDADLGAGMIDESEARRRREELEDETSFYGAMDGASKFVRGDAVAGIIITLINLIGGILIGVLSHGLTMGEAANVYTILTIGDGLVTQIPALLVSLAAGIVVTKGGTEGATNEAVLSQLGSYPKALYMAGALLLGIALLPGFPAPIFVALAALLAGLGYTLQRSTAAEENAAAREKAAAEANDATEESVAQTMKLDDIRLCMGDALVSMVNRPEAGLPAKIKSLRKLFARDFGFVLQSVRITDDSNLPGTTYAILLHGVEIARGDIRPGSMMVIASSEDSKDLHGERAKDPTFGLDVLWVDRGTADAAEERGLTVVDPESVITTHLTEILKDHMPDLLTYGATKELIEGLDRDYQKLASDIPGGQPTILLQQVLQALLSERVSIRNLPGIVEAVAEATRKTSDVTRVTNHVRQRLANQISKSLTDPQGFVPVIALNPSWEREFSEALRQNGDDRSLVMSPQRVQEFVLEARKEIQRFAQHDEWPAVLVSPEVRSFVRSMLERCSPATQVVSHNEIHRKAVLKTVARIGG
ncbi:flagellar biosynthesis protein FlhA [Roseibacterium sp. SDUM158016]|uniref:flagellar biosynthesis protein FlhA n=1 Tax=Roseicyclus sediminis TaxID=2980997 RepID=UPI0021CE6876|nr:flagellar biosynthesis protein FlhA [Roseibacterium sp. SDUM158016]MCU4654313.1 flagellar biosynthesis protein FlhA [Roseibacterium sp. SDUM158016]